MNHDVTFQQKSSLLGYKFLLGGWVYVDHENPNQMFMLLGSAVLEKN